MAVCKEDRFYFPSSREVELTGGRIKPNQDRGDLASYCWEGLAYKGRRKVSVRGRNSDECIRLFLGRATDEKWCVERGFEEELKEG